MTESQLKALTLPVLCPTCGQIDHQIISELISNQTIPCRFCGSPIDISSKEWRDRIAKTAEDIRNIKILKT